MADDPKVLTAERQPFWSKNKKALALLALCGLVLLLARACGAKHETLSEFQKQQKAEQQQEQQTAARQQIEDLEKRLESAQRTAEAQQAQAKQMAAQQAAAANTLDVSTLTPAQRAVLAGAPAPAVTPTTPELPQRRGTTEILSYRSESAIASTVTQEPPRPVPTPKARTAAWDTPTKSPATDVPLYRIREGTLLPCTELLRINGAFAGRINCMISIPIYDPTGVHLLIPQGSVALGDIHKVASQDQERLFVSFHRIVEPDGYSINLDKFTGLDQIGQTGLKGKVNRHILRALGLTGVVAGVAGLAEIGAYSNSGVYSPMDMYRAGVTENLSEGSMQILNRFLNVMPSFEIHEGSRGQLYVMQDLHLPDVKDHPITKEE